jgi:acyl dehydratase
VQKGLLGKPTSAVRTDAETLTGLFGGTVDAQKAFMARKIVVDNIGDMMKFGRAFELKPATPAAAEAPVSAPVVAAPQDDEARAAAIATEAQAETGINRAQVGKFYPGEVSMSSAEEMKAYAQAVGETNPVYLDEERAGGIVAHPIFPVRYFHEVLTPVVTDPELRMDLLRLVHGEQEMILHRPLHPKEILYPVARLVSVEDKSSGQLAKFHLTLQCEGRPVAEAITGIFIRGKKKDGAKKEEEAKPVRGEPAVTPLRGGAEDQPKRYAAASGDSNPIHLDPEVAQAAGLPGVILHGLCTMAIAAQGIVEKACNGDPSRLKRIAVRFAKPVRPGTTLETRAWQVDAQGSTHVFEFETFDADGRCVLEKGRAEVTV